MTSKAEGECAGKKGFVSKAAARRAISGHSARGDIAKMHAYQCSRCHKWHVGNRS